MFEALFFYIFAAVAVIAAVAVVSLRNPVHSAVALIVCFVQVAAIFVLLRAPFLAAVQVFVYVGAVMVLFLFAILVMDVGGVKLKEYLHGQSLPAAALSVLLFALMAYMASSGRVAETVLGVQSDAALAKNTELIGKELFTRFIYPFEVVSVILLLALVGAIALVMREKKDGE